MQIGWGYEHLREVVADTAHEEHEGMLEWPSLDSASEFDPARFDVDDVNGPRQARRRTG